MRAQKPKSLQQDAFVGSKYATISFLWWPESPRRNGWKGKWGRKGVYWNGWGKELCHLSHKIPESASVGKCEMKHMALINMRIKQSASETLQRKINCFLFNETEKDLKIYSVHSAVNQTKTICICLSLDRLSLVFPVSTSLVSSSFSLRTYYVYWVLKLAVITFHSTTLRVYPPFVILAHQSLDALLTDWFSCHI